jgi:ParB/RepB/Spo0J family partition protein
VAKNKRVINIPFEQIVLDKEFNSRREYENIDELKDSILRDGLLQPMGVVKSEGKEDQYFLVYGFRRYLAIEKARTEIGGDAFATVDVVLNVGTLDDLRNRNLTENLERSDLKPHEVAQQIKKMVNAGLDQRDIGKRLGRPQSWVSYYYTLATKLGAHATKAFETGEITFEQALDIAKVPEKNQKDVVDVVSKATTKQDARKAVKAAVKKSGKSTSGSLTRTSKPTQKNLNQYVQDASFEALSDATDEEYKGFWNGVAAGIQVALGKADYDTVNPDESYVDPNFGKAEKEEKAPKASKKAEKKNPVL